MPLYDMKCQKCGKEEERIARIDEDSLPCTSCGGNAKRQLHGRFGISMGVGAYGYFDENLGCYIGTNAEKKRVMAEQGVSEGYGKGWK